MSFDWVFGMGAMVTMFAVLFGFVQPDLRITSAAAFLALSAILLHKATHGQ